jgi:histidinol-phosphate aminotransferase
LSALPGLRCFRSDANMVLVQLPDAGVSGGNAAAAAFARMRDRGVLVKDVSGMHPLLRNCLRLTVGTADENRAMLEALKECP